jgi:hypothetical protein
VKGNFFFEYGIEMCPYIGGTAIGKETVQLRVFEEDIHSRNYVEEEFLALLLREAKGMAVYCVFTNTRPKEDGIFFIGDDIAESVLPERTQPEGRVALMVLSPHFDGDDDVTPVGERE